MYQPAGLSTRRSPQVEGREDEQAALPHGRWFWADLAAFLGYPVLTLPLIKDITKQSGRQGVGSTLTALTRAKGVTNGTG